MCHEISCVCLNICMSHVFLSSLDIAAEVNCKLTGYLIGLKKSRYFKNQTILAREKWISDSCELGNIEQY